MFEEMMQDWWWKRNSFSYRVNNSYDAVAEAMSYMFDYYWNKLNYKEMLKKV